MRTLKFKAQPTNAFFATVNQMLAGSSQLSTAAERAVIKSLCAVQTTTRVRALAGDIVLCSWARHFTFTVLLFTQVYKWVPANLMLGGTLRWTSIPSRQGGVEILLVASCYRNRDKLRPGGPLGSNTDFTFYLVD